MIEIYMKAIVKIPKNIEKFLTEMASKKELDKVSTLKNALEAYLEDLMDYHRAKKISEEIKSGKRKTIKWEKVKKQMGFK